MSPSTPTHFLLPPHKTLSISTPEASPLTHLHTTESTNEDRAVPAPNLFARPEPLRAVSTPPASPTKGKTSTARTGRTYTRSGNCCIDMDEKEMSLGNLELLRANGGITPPRTPPAEIHSDPTPAPSTEVRPSNTENPENRTTPKPTEPTSTEEEEPRTTEPLIFPYWETDYEGLKDGRPGDNNKLLGSGLWCSVYLARPTPSNEPPPSISSLAQNPMTNSPKDPLLAIETRSSMTPPLTLTEKRHPEAYAIKLPTSRTALRVLTAESAILSHLSLLRPTNSKSYIVPFFGQDSRNGALVLEAKSTTLESWIDSLNALDEPTRASTLAATFPKLATDLLDGLVWLGDAGVVHADIRPANLLLDLSSENPLQPVRIVYSDFSSSILTTPTPTKANSKTSQSPLGGTTWDFLSPSLVRPPFPAPTPQTDLHALAITLLYLIIGTSPFDCAGKNMFRRREMVKQGAPMLYVTAGEYGARNLKRIKALGMKEWFEKVFKGMGVREAREAFGKIIGGE